MAVPAPGSSDINFISYNSTGWNEFKAGFIKNIMNSKCAHICALQEHFLLKDNVCKIEQYMQDYEVFAVPAFKSDLCISAGRPSGGLAVIYSKNIGHCVSRVTVPNSRRVQGISLSTQGEKILLINAYFPTDNRQENNTELITTLQDIKFLLEEYGVGSKVVVMGDLNCDFARDTSFVQIVQNFITTNNFMSVWTKFQCDFTYSQSRDVNGVLSTCSSVIDHFLVSSEDLVNCEEAMPVHTPSNMSNHEPICLKFRYNMCINRVTNAEATAKSVPCWKRAKPNQIQGFKSDLDDKLFRIDIPEDALFCRNVRCSEANHKTCLDDLSEDVMGSIEDAVRQNIPYSITNRKRKKPVPGWSTFVAPFKEDADFWDSIWVSAGRPQNTELHRVAKHTKYKYHRVIKKVKNCEKEIRKSNFLSDCLDGKVQNILKEVKRLKGNSCKSGSNIDGLGNPQDISNHFQNLYKGIFNVHSDDEDVKSILDEIKAGLNQSDIEIVDKINPELVKRVIQNISNDKNDPMFEFRSNAFKTGVDSLCAPLSDLIKAFIIHGHIPDIFLVCSLIPIIKNNRASSLSSENYRLIAITSLILKLFDGVLLELCGKDLKPSSLQFGFQRGQSTTMASWTLMETVSYFTSRGGPVYLCLLDLTKAFDHVKFSTMFRLLKERIPAILLRFIIFSYTHQQCSVMWQNSRSESFLIKNGVRQGSIASPTYFNLYIDQIFKDLQDSNLGCMIGDLYYGILGYADDLALLAPSRGTLQLMVTKCERFFSSRGIRVSTNPVVEKSKTVCLGFGLKYTPEPLVLYGNQLPFVKSHKHLGHIITDNESMKMDLDDKVNQMIGKFHSLRQQVGRQDPFVMITLVNTYLLSLYGSNIWDLSARDSERIDKSWNSLVRSVFELPPDTHRFIVENLVTVKHIRIKVLKRFQNFYKQLQRCGKSEVLQLIRLTQNDNRSIFGRNCMHLLQKTKARSICEADIDSLSIYPVPEESEWKLSVIRDLIDCK